MFPVRLLAAGLCALLALGATPAANASDFERYHPDQRFRQLGLAALERNDHEWAFRWFRKAARFADKASQAMLAEMYWDGIGTRQDPARAYAWMDLAAERHYRMFLLKREAYWAALDAAQRERAIEVGTGLYAEYGDAVAKPRLEAQLRRGSRKSTGSRLGARGGLRVYSAGPGGNFQWVPDYYADRHWKPEAYWAEQDRLWRNPMRGTVTVSPVVPEYAVPERAPPALPPVAPSGDE